MVDTNEQMFSMQRQEGILWSHPSSLFYKKFVMVVGLLLI